jgi:hypothetical protein
MIRYHPAIVAQAAATCAALPTLLGVGELLAQKVPETGCLRPGQRETDTRVSVSNVGIAQSTECQQHAVGDLETLDEWFAA